jgi:hypothetical protein
MSAFISFCALVIAALHEPVILSSRALLTLPSLSGTETSYPPLISGMLYLNFISTDMEGFPSVISTLIFAFGLITLYEISASSTLALSAVYFSLSVI